jgi:hypothetical protein
MRRQQTVWVCRKSGQVFLRREKFREHLLSLRTSQQHEHRRARIIAAGDAFAAQCSSIAELEDWLNNSSFFLDFARLTDPAAKSTLADFKFSDIYTGDCSNSHSAPRGLSTNWWGRGPTGEAGVPRSYPGISCNIHFKGEIKSKEHWSCRATDALKAIGICTGTGGGGGNNTYRYGCTIWAQHFPKLYRNLIARDVARQLGFDTSAITVSVHETR